MFNTKITTMKTKDFSYRLTVKELEAKSVSLEFTQMVEDGELSWDDEVQITYDSEEDELTGIVVDGNLSYGHVFEPTSFEKDSELVIELSKI